MGIACLIIPFFISIPVGSTYCRRDWASFFLFLCSSWSR